MTEDRTIDTYRDLLNYLTGLSSAQLDQKAQIFVPTHEEIVRLLPMVAIGTYLSDQEQTRSSYDGQHHPQDIVILADPHPFGKNGEAFWRLTDDGEEPAYLRDHPDVPADAVDFVDGVSYPCED